MEKLRKEGQEKFESENPSLDFQEIFHCNYLESKTLPRQSIDIIPVDELAEELKGGK